MKTQNPGPQEAGSPTLGAPLAIALLALGALLFLNSAFFVLKEVRVTGIRRLSEAEVLVIAGLDVRTNVFRVVPKSVCDKLGKDPRIRSAVVERRLPSTVTIRIEEREPLYAIPYAEGLAAVVGTDGIIMADSPDPMDVPRIIGVKASNLLLGGRVTHPRISAAAEFHRLAAPEVRSRISEVDMSREAQITMYLSGGVIVELGGHESARRKMEALSFVLADGDRRRKKIARINLHNPDSPTVRWTN